MVRLFSVCQRGVENAGHQLSTDVAAADGQGVAQRQNVRVTSSGGEQEPLAVKYTRDRGNVHGTLPALWNFTVITGCPGRMR